MDSNLPCKWRIPDLESYKRLPMGNLSGTQIDSMKASILGQPWWGFPWIIPLNIIEEIDGSPRWSWSIQSVKFWPYPEATKISKWSVINIRLRHQAAIYLTQVLKSPRMHPVSDIHTIWTSPIETLTALSSLLQEKIYMMMIKGIHWDMSLIELEILCKQASRTLELHWKP